MRSLFVLTVLLTLSACSKKEEAAPAAVDAGVTVAAPSPEVVAGTPTVTETSSVTVTPAVTPVPVTETPAPVVSK